MRTFIAALIAIGAIAVKINVEEGTEDNRGTSTGIPPQDSSIEPICPAEMITLGCFVESSRDWGTWCNCMFAEKDDTYRPNRIKRSLASSEPS